MEEIYNIILSACHAHLKEDEIFVAGDDGKYYKVSSVVEITEEEFNASEDEE